MRDAETPHSAQPAPAAAPDAAETVWKRGLCGICPAGCFVEVALAGGRLVDMRPDTSHPLGMICRRGQHAAEIVYSEHRLRHPLRRKGPKGSYDFERISWDEAYDLIVTQARARARGVGGRGSRHLHGPRQLRAEPVRHVPAQGRRGLVGLERPVPLRLAQHAWASGRSATCRSP